LIGKNPPGNAGRGKSQALGGLLNVREDRASSGSARPWASCPCRLLGARGRGRRSISASRGPSSRHHARSSRQHARNFLSFCDAIALPTAALASGDFGTSRSQLLIKDTPIAGVPDSGTQGQWAHGRFWPISAVPAPGQRVRLLGRSRRAAPTVPGRSAPPRGRGALVSNSRYHGAVCLRSQMVLSDPANVPVNRTTRRRKSEPMTMKRHLLLLAFVLICLFWPLHYFFGIGRDLYELASLTAALVFLAAIRLFGL
jgi:hypothetical protein